MILILTIIYIYIYMDMCIYNHTEQMVKVFGKNQLATNVWICFCQVELPSWTVVGMSMAYLWEAALQVLANLGVYIYMHIYT